MTGLDPDACHILEIASLVTDSNLEVLAEGPNLVIHNTEEQLATLSDWSRDFFGKSGLVDRVRAASTSCAEAEARTLTFLHDWVPTGTSPLCGNSIWQDRRFLTRYMPAVEGFLHYRMIDVSTVKELARRWKPDLLEQLTKDGKHLALDDIRESIEELAYYRKAVMSGSQAPTST